MGEEYNIGIIGCGVTGKGLFDHLSGFSFPVTLICHREEKARQIKAGFERQLNRALKYGLITQELHDLRRQKTVITSNPEKLAICNLVIETITENAEKKKELFRQIEPIVSKDCLLASNTSSIPPEKLFSGMKNPERCLGLHFFFPVGMQNYVEINVSDKTGEQIVEQVKKFLETIGKKYLVLTGNDHFIINRMFLKMQAGCCRILQEGKLNVTQIDEIVRNNLFPAGIFRFFDVVGNDVMLRSVKNYSRYENDGEFLLPLIECLEEKVRNDKLGKKTKTGFYDYPLKPWSNESESLDETEKKEILKTITGWYLGGIYKVLEKSVCSKTDLEQIVKEYLMVEKSPFDLAEETGYVFNN